MKLSWFDAPRRHPSLPRIAFFVACAILSLCPPMARAQEASSDHDWWSLQPVSRPSLPEDNADLENPIDRFIVAKHRSNGLNAVPSTDKLTLLRRVYLDLIGIPPSPEEQEAFLADSSPDAYEKVANQLLDSEQHAVRYARHWLDVLRYADEDAEMTAAPGIYLWREWMINALHDDIPYDEFVQLQLTGRRADERTEMTATGFRREKEPRPGDQFALGFLARGTGEHPQELAINAVDTVSSAFMGMTLECAKCHDHMFDPISEVDYYSMKALFDPLVLEKVTLASADELMEAGKAIAEREKARAPHEKAIADLLKPYRDRLYEERLQMLPPDVQTIIRMSEQERSVEEQKIADDYFPVLRIDGDKINEVLPNDVRDKLRDLERQRDDASRELRVPRIPVFHTVKVDPVREQEKSYILTSAEPTRPELRNEVQPGWPFSKGDYDFREGRIEAFSDWLTAPDNPLFARVAVNRLWQWHFGVGLHSSPSDFGKQMGEPSHPELLDWLASEFVRQDYGMKEMHRLMVTSQTYQMASDFGPEHEANLTIDPQNKFLWHFRLQRLEAEPIWDSIHAASGNLDLTVGGRSFEPREPRRERSRRGRRDDDESADRTQYRRGAYITRGFSVNREVTPNFLQSFDVDDGRAPCPIRTQTVTAPQSLFLMNSPAIEAAASELADRLQRESDGDFSKAIEQAYRLTLARPPTSTEAEQATIYMKGDPDRLKSFAWLLFNLDEFIYVR